MIVDRAKEKKELETAFKSIDGIRRVGKTCLIKDLFQSKKGIFFQTTVSYIGALKDQLDRPLQHRCRL